MNRTLNELFVRPISDTECEVDDYSELLESIVTACPDANVVRESQQWSKFAAIDQGDCTIYDADELTGETLPFDPSEVAVQVTYYYDTAESQWDLAWVATWPWD